MRTKTKGRHLKLAKFEMIKANSFKIVRLRAVLKLGAFITQLIQKNWSASIRSADSKYLLSSDILRGAVSGGCGATALWASSLQS